MLLLHCIYRLKNLVCKNTYYATVINVNTIYKSFRLESANKRIHCHCGNQYEYYLFQNYMYFFTCNQPLNIFIGSIL